MLFLFVLLCAFVSLSEPPFVVVSLIVSLFDSLFSCLSLIICFFDCLLHPFLTSLTLSRNMGLH